jgi:hypothetical protein
VALIPFILALAVNQPVSDTARIADRRLVIEPLGASFEIPPTWFDPPTYTKTCEYNSPVASRFHVTRETIAKLPRATGEWDKEFSAVVDSVMPFSGTVAQIGSEGWGAESRCFGDLQVRVYVTDLPLDSLVTRAKTQASETANRFFPAKPVAEADTLGWRVEKLSWDAWYFDYGATAVVEFYFRRVREKTVALVFMHALASNRGELDRDFILHSFRE